MEAAFRFLADYEGLIYLVLLLGALFNLRWLARAWREKREAIYGLEREFATKRLTTAAGGLAFILLLCIGEFFLATFILPLLPSSTFLATPTADLLATPTGTLSPDVLTTGTPGAEAPFGATGCIPGQIVITAPRPGQEVSGTVDLVGTVNVANMGFYKIEIAPQGNDTWSTIFAGQNTIKDDSLGQWITTELTPGDYRLRLVVTDNQGQALPPCVVPVRIKP
jgi:hypothetical protein